MNFRCFMFLATVAVSFLVQAAEPVPLADFARHMKFKNVKISPDGKHVAVTSIINGKTVLSLIDLEKNTGLTVVPRDDNQVLDFWWVSSERVVYSGAQDAGVLEQPASSGELFGVNFDGKGKDALFGYRVDTSQSGSTGSHIEKKKNEYAGASMLDELRDDDKNALITVQRWNWSHVPVAGGEELHPEARRIDVQSGLNKTVAVAPLTVGSFLVDNHGEVRFFTGPDLAWNTRVYYREGKGKDWELVFDEAKTGVSVQPVAFNRAGDAVYFRCPGTRNVGGVCLWDVAKRTFTTLWSGTEAGPIGFEMTFDGQDVFAIRSMPGRTAVVLLDKKAEEAKVLVDLMQQFPGEDVRFGNASYDGKKVIVIVQGDRNPGAFYLYDAEAKKLSFLMARAPWIEPAGVAVMEPFAFKARDGMPLHGYLTKPLGMEESKNLPMVVYVHGGPYGVRDDWGYDATVQALASRGYAVLQVNFRGSGGYGDAFVKAGYREWGAKMQDDVTDATHWAIEQGSADPKRICIFGGSYGGYAALQGVVREPDLYRCAIGYAGVYDLGLMKSRGDIPQSMYGDNYLDMVLGKDDAVLAQRSPILQLDRLKAKVMLIVGGQDKRVPPVHGENLRIALGKRGVELEWLYQATEGHSFYDEANATDMYAKVIAFLDRNTADSAKPAVAVDSAKAATE